ncbi:MAG: hypothetical protein KDD34_07995 [Bdellovibrionales bacterium]|nr:hypothetical protein [Bdellovibrionales bacterium]
MSETTQAATSSVNMNTLPAVASNFYYHCKKCGVDRYHKVLTHPTATSAKLECEVCKGKQTFKVGVAKKKATGKKGVSRKKTQSTEEVWMEKKANINMDKVETYNMKKKFSADTAIEHPKFGIGVVTDSNGLSIMVTFKDGEKSLVHNRA